MAPVLGSQAVDALIDRAAEEASLTHPELLGLRLSRGRLDVDGLGQSFEGSSAEAIAAAFSALNAVVLLILSRLVGRQLAEAAAGQEYSPHRLPNLGLGT
jgi:hypothetical protein